MKQNEFEIVLTKVLDATSTMFEIATGTKIRACIKILKVQGGLKSLTEEKDENKRFDLIYADLFVKNSDSDWPKKSREDYPYDKDYIARNTAFKCILKGSINYYIENDIRCARKKGKYDSTSFIAYGEGKPGRPNWVLPYRSTMIWPIRKLTGTEYGEAQRELLVDKHDMFGFLCVDSESRNVWEDRFDSQIGASIADMLYAFMNAWYLDNGPYHPAINPAKLDTDKPD